MISDRIDTSLTTKPGGKARRSSLSPTDRQRLRRTAPPAFAREPCWLEGCPCEGIPNEVHGKHLAEFQTSGKAGPVPLSEELCNEIADLLGYPSPPKGKRMMQIAAGELDWCRDATEADWRRTLDRIVGCNPQRNPDDGSVREGYVRAVLKSVMGGD